MDAIKRVSTVLLEAAGLVPIVTLCLVEYAKSMGAQRTLHLAQTLRTAQIGLLVLFVFPPWLVAIAHRAAPLGAAAVLLAGACNRQLGTALRRRKFINFAGSHRCRGACTYLNT